MFGIPTARSRHSKVSRERLSFEANCAETVRQAAENQTPEGSGNLVGFSSDQTTEEGERTLCTLLPSLREYT